MVSSKSGKGRRDACKDGRPGGSFVARKHGAREGGGRPLAFT